MNNWNLGTSLVAESCYLHDAVRTRRGSRTCSWRNAGFVNPGDCWRNIVLDTNFVSRPARLSPTEKTAYFSCIDLQKLFRSFPMRRAFLKRMRHHDHRQEDAVVDYIEPLQRLWEAAICIYGGVTSSWRLLFSTTSSCGGPTLIPIPQIHIPPLLYPTPPSLSHPPFSIPATLFATPSAAVSPWTFCNNSHHDAMKSSTPYRSTKHPDRPPNRLYSSLPSTPMHPPYETAPPTRPL